MIYLDVACNDPDNGIFDYRAHQIQIGDAELEPKYWGRSPRFVELDSAIRLSGKTWNIDWSKEYVGNWCWNRYLLLSPDNKITHRWYLVEFCRWLRGRDLFDISTAPTTFFDWWKRERELTLAQLHSAICELEPIQNASGRQS